MELSLIKLCLEHKTQNRMAAQSATILFWVLCDPCYSFPSHNKLVFYCGYKMVSGSTSIATLTALELTSIRNSSKLGTLGKTSGANFSKICQR